jgi:hypothetical protein
METYNIYIFQQINEHNSRTEQIVKSEIELNLPLMVSEHVHKFLRICLRGTYVIEQKPDKKKFWQIKGHNSRIEKYKSLRNNRMEFYSIKRFIFYQIFL